MSRRILSSEKIHPNLEDKIGGGYTEVLNEVIEAIQSQPIVIVGMKTNPFVKKARRIMAAHNITVHYIEYGGYLSSWYKRLVIKMWSGLSTFPQVFVRGTLVGGYDDLKRIIDSGEIKTLLKDE